MVVVLSSEGHLRSEKFRDNERKEIPQVVSVLLWWCNFYGNVSPKLIYVFPRSDQ